MKTTLLQISGASGEVSNKFMQFLNNFGLSDSLTKIAGGLAILVIGFFLAKWISSFVSKMIKKTGLDNKVKGDIQISSMIGKIIYYLLMIIVLMSALNIMGVGETVLAPLNDMVSSFMAAIPNIVGAGIIIYAGYFLAKIISEVVEFSGGTIQKIAPKLKLPENIDLVKVIKNIVFIFVFIPVLIIGLDFLNFDVITDPAKSMLSQFLAAVPMIIKAMAILAVTYFGGKLLVDLLAELLVSLKFDQIGDKVGIDNLLGTKSLSKLVSKVLFVFILYMGVMQALEVLQLTQVTEVLNEVMHVAGNVMMGLIILLLGNFIANFVAGLMGKSENANKFTTAIIRGAVLCIFLAMGLRAMDIANDIINLAFGLSLGAIAVAFALSFGLGGKEEAGKQMKNFFDKMKK